MTAHANQGDAYSIGPHTPPTSQELTDVMGAVATAFMDTAGVQVYYIVDQTNVAWDDLDGYNDRSAFMGGCRDNGSEGEDDYRDFVHLAFVDNFADDLNVVGFAFNGYDGCLVSIFMSRQFALRNSVGGVTFVESLSSTATHELGHCVKCADHDTAAGDYIMYKKTSARCNNIRFCQSGIEQEIPSMDVAHNYAQ